MEQNEKFDITVYDGKIKDKVELLNSSTGGVFTALSDVFFENIDVILCSLYNYILKQMDFELIIDLVTRDEGTPLSVEYYVSSPVWRAV